MIEILVGARSVNKKFKNRYILRGLLASNNDVRETPNL